MSPTEHYPDRRTFLALGAGVGAALLTGCSLNNPFDNEKTPAAEAVQDLPPDVATAVQAVALIRTVQANLEATRQAYPGLQKSLAGLTELHAAHLGSLQDAVPDGVDTAPASEPRSVPGTRSGALGQVEVDERALRSALVGLAVRVESGTFARLLGSIAAGVSQHLEALRR